MACIPLMLGHSLRVYEATKAPRADYNFSCDVEGHIVQGKQPRGPKMDGARRISRAQPGSPWLTSAAPDRGERRRPALTRQNGKGNVQVDVVQVLATCGGEVRAQSLKSRQGVAQDHKRAPDCRGSRTSSKELKQAY